MFYKGEEYSRKYQKILEFSEYSEKFQSVLERSTMLLNIVKYLETSIGILKILDHIAEREKNQTNSSYERANIGRCLSASIFSKTPTNRRRHLHSREKFPTNRFEGSDMKHR